jgi:hypothetical protein
MSKAIRKCLVTPRLYFTIPTLPDYVMVVWYEFPHIVMLASSTRDRKIKAPRLSHTWYKWFDARSSKQWFILKRRIATRGAKHRVAEAFRPRIRIKAVMGDRWPPSFGCAGTTENHGAPQNPEKGNG